MRKSFVIITFYEQHLFSAADSAILDPSYFPGSSVELKINVFFVFCFSIFTDDHIRDEWQSSLNWEERIGDVTLIPPMRPGIQELLLDVKPEGVLFHLRICSTWGTTCQVTLCRTQSPFNPPPTSRLRRTTTRRSFSEGGAFFKGGNRGISTGTGIFGC
jgi:hypothetical protein